MSKIITHIKNNLIFLICFFTIIIAGFVLNHLSAGWYNTLGIKPREISLSNLYGMAMSWSMHGDFNHLKGNLTVLSQIMLLFVIVDKQPVKTLMKLIAYSSILVFLFGSPNSIHIGASGIFYALCGYIVGAAFFNVNIFYILALIMIGGEYAYIIQSGLFPKEGISFIGHLGGFIAGLFLSYEIRKQRESEKSSFTYESNKSHFSELKDKYENWKFKRKHKLN